MKVIITIEAEIDELEAECFHNNMQDSYTDDDLDGQADLVKDIMRLEGINRPKIWWKVENPKPFSYIKKIFTWNSKENQEVCTEQHYTDDVLIKEEVKQEGFFPLIRHYVKEEK